MRKEAYAVYVEVGENCREVADAQVPAPYQKYNIAVAPAVEDQPENVVVIPESFILAVPHYTKAQVCVWWMSVDNAISWDKNFKDCYHLEKDRKERRRLLWYEVKDKLKDTFLWNIYLILLRVCSIPSS